MHKLRPDQKRQRDKFTIIGGEFKTPFSGINRPTREKTNKKRQNKTNKKPHKKP